ncbi:MAG TPA: hypothetical protein VG755_04285 [Nannocystaceae bacterium]|nr:hypothetical protein [Nannocystaceae bacterium]
MHRGIRSALVLVMAAGCNNGDDAATGSGDATAGVDSSGSAEAASDPSDGSTGGASTDASSTSATSADDGSSSDGPSDDTGDTGPIDVACADGRITAPFAALPELARVQGIVRGTGVALQFEPVDGARDYRVYALPSADAVSEVDGEVHVENATYRCAGDRAAIDLPYFQNGYLTVDTAIAGDIAGYTRNEDESTLGYVFTIEGDGRVPVYALGSPESGHDGQCFGGRTSKTRALRYTTDEGERASLLDAGWRDDGIAFYTTADADRDVHFADAGGTWVFYASDAEVGARGAGETELAIASAQAEGMVPLRRFWISPCGGIAHDVLSAGESRFQRDFAEGAQPVWALDWPTLEPDQVLVVEALDAGCPFQGHLSARAVPPTGYAQEFVTLDDVRAAAAHGEVFVNGQHDGASVPKPIARSFVCPEITDVDAMDVFEEFSAPMGFAQVDLVTSGGWALYLENDDFAASFFSIEPDVFGLDAVLGELWVTYADWASDTNGRFRLTSKTDATIGDDSFVHATVEVDLFSTSRRYPQLWISSAAVPVQDNMTEGVTLNLQAFGAWPTGLEMQWCDHRYWDVNDQCPIFPTQHADFEEQPWPAQPFVADLTASGVRVRLDLWVSTDRAYAFIDGKPHSCIEAPGLLPAGAVTVTYGDTLYHSGVDEPVVGTDFMDFLREHQLTETRRHVDNYGFSSGVSEPAWDHARLPCAVGLP